MVFSFYNYFRTYFLFIRRNFVFFEGILVILGFKIEKNFVDKINFIERKLFFIIVNVYFKVGCFVLVLEVFFKILKVIKIFVLFVKKDEFDLIFEKMGDVFLVLKILSDGNGSFGIDWLSVIFL